MIIMLEKNEDLSKNYKKRVENFVMTVIKDR